MGYSDQEGQNQRNYRYSVSRLLDLSRDRSITFDLSKFSYSAVRAGVVPALKVCAMSLRDVSGNRPRGWSSETTSTMEDCVVYQGSNVQHPLRQPTHAPPEIISQTDEGFARFLKKHTSPTHQRVTAGGRIVPMEKKPTPPQFPLSKDSRVQKEIFPRYLEDEVAVRSTNSNPKAEKVDCERVRNVNEQISVKKSTPRLGAVGEAILKPNSIITQGAGAVLSATSMESLFFGASQAMYPPVITPAHLSQNSTLDHMVSYTAPMFNPGLIPLAATMSMYPSQYAMTPFSNGLWQYPEQYLVPASQVPVVTGIEAQSNTMALQSSLQHETAVFEELDQQLKDMDRHRAMHSLDPSLVNQRITIVQHRAAAKDNIRRLRIALNIEPELASSNQAFRPTNGLNVKAAAYVPRSASKRTEASPLASRKDSDDKNETRVLYPGNKTAVAQSPGYDDPFVTGADVTAKILDSPELEAVDAWGARLGRAPRDLERQQSALSASMIGELSSSSDGDDESMQGDLLETVEKPQTGVEDDLISGGEGQVDNGDFHHPEWLPVNPGRAPPEVEKGYALHLDALRKPRGVVTHLHLFDRDLISVEGQGLQRPASADMNEFEKEYWSLNPEKMAEKAAQSIDPHKENSAGEYNMMAWNGAAMEHEHSGGLVVPRRDQKKVLADILRTNSYDRGRSQLHGPSRNTATDNFALLSPVSASGMSDEHFGSHSSHAFQAGEANLRNHMSNKGYSSVAVQNIHAITRLPQGLDGAIDATQRKIQNSALASKCKAKSPRVFHCTTATGEAWYGPFRRNDFGEAEEGDTPRTHGFKRIFY